MKTVHAIGTGVLALALAGSGLVHAASQQTGGVPIPPPPRPGSPAAEAAAARDEATNAVATPGPAAPVAAPAAPGATRLSPEAAAALSSATRPVGARTQQTSLLLEIESSRADTPISVAVYRDADSFRRNETPVRTHILARSGPITRAYVANLPAGPYAIVAWQDVDGDGKPTRARFGGISEPHGYSRDARAPRFGSPRFEDAVFDLQPGGVTQRIVLRGGR